jgi:hypothetical protein
MIFAFESLDLPLWIAKYRSDIRVVVDWAALAESSIQVEQNWLEPGRTHGVPLEYPWYTSGSWMREKKVRRVVEGRKTSNVLLRAPGVRYRALESSDKGQRYLLLDRCHRISELRPRLIVLDTLVLKTKSEMRIFGDLL